MRISSLLQLVAKLTVYIKETYSACNPTFAYSDSFNPKRILTRPSVGVSNDGFDNANSDLILGVNTVLINQEADR
jgi:dual specificity protein kinase YAK1